MAGKWKEKEDRNEAYLGEWRDLQAWSRTVRENWLDKQMEHGATAEASDEDPPPNGHTEGGQQSWAFRKFFTKFHC